MTRCTAFMAPTSLGPSGLNMSSGCIRMMNQDVEHLYEKAKIGTKVVVIGPGRNSNKVYTQGGVNPFSALFGG